MNRMVVGLLLVVVLLVGALMYTLGQKNGGVDGADEGKVALSAEDEAAAKKKAEDEAKAKEEADKEKQLAEEQERAKLKRQVRVGTEGPYASACLAIGSVANLPGGSDDFLAVREGPTVSAKETDKLGDDQPIYICDQNEDGSWIGIVYQAGGYLPIADDCKVEAPVASRRAYAGPCLSGWVSAKYIEVRTQG